MFNGLLDPSMDLSKGALLEVRIDSSHDKHWWSMSLFVIFFQFSRDMGWNTRLSRDAGSPYFFCPLRQHLRLPTHHELIIICVYAPFHLLIQLDKKITPRSHLSWPSLCSSAPLRSCDQAHGARLLRWPPVLRF